MKALLKKYLNTMIASNIDYLVLGCSHYPYLIPQIKKILPSNIKIIDSGEAVAKQTKKILNEKVGFREINEKSKQLFYTNTNPKVLIEILENKFKVIEKDF
jgi:glutamate racemase